MAVSMIGPKFYAWDRDGKPLAFGKVYTYKARTNAPKDTFQSEDGIVANTNPVILNGEGYANIYLDGSYKIVVKDAEENEIWTTDPVTAQGGEEWVNCVSASYLSPTSFKVTGNVTDRYDSGRRVRIDSGATEYTYSSIESSTFSGGETTVTIIDSVVSTGIIVVCASIVGNQSGVPPFKSLLTAEELKLQNLAVGQVVSSVGRENKKDGGAASYIVVAGGTGVADGGSYIDMDNGLQLELIVSKGVISSESFLSLDSALSFAESNGIAFVTYGKRSVITDSSWNPQNDPVYARTTPETALQSIGGHYDELGAAGRNYRWGHNSWFTNGGTAPVTNYSAVSQGYKVRSVDATTRQIGAGGDAHALEIISGQWAAKANCSLTSGSNVITVNNVTFKGSRFCIGDVVSGDGIPLGSVVTEVSQNSKTVTGFEIETVSETTGGGGYAEGDVLTLVGGSFNRASEITVLQVDGSGSVQNAIVSDGGDYTSDPTGVLASSGGSGSGAEFDVTGLIAGYGTPDSITINNNATLTTDGVLEFRCDSNLNIGLLISGSGDGCPDESGNANGSAIQIQAYGDAAYYRGVRFSGGGIRQDGSALYASFADWKAFLEVDSSNFDSLIDINGTDCDDSLLKVQGMNANYGLRFHNSNNYTFSAIYLDGQDIGSSSTNGMRIATNQNSKLGFWGKTPVARPNKVDRPTGGVTIDAECRAQLDDLLDKLESIGILPIS